MDIKEKLNNYINSYIAPKESFFKRAKAMFGNTFAMEEIEEECYLENDINSYINENKEDETFQTKLFKLIDNKEVKDSDVYNKVDIDRRLFSKIRSNKNYHPSKETVILLGIALELNEDEIEDLLKSASYSLPMNTTFDLIIRFCFKEKIYDVNQINEFLYDHKCKILN